MHQSVIFNRDLINRYNNPVSRYTSYPSTVNFHEYDEDQYRRVVAESNGSPAPRPLSLYIHIPFCKKTCLFCECERIITSNRQHAIRHLQNLHMEIEMQGNLFDKRRPVDQIHFGGGTPTYLSNDQMCELLTVLSEHFYMRIDDSGEYSIEVDPRTVDSHGIFLLRKLGFNRISFGMQDFDPSVQKAINRIQSYEESRDVVYAARDARFTSINVDLVYGLPLQTTVNFEQTLEKVIELNPDRITIYNYEHTPNHFKSQKQINKKDLPSAQEKIQLLQVSIHCLAGAGYIYIGMDQFARQNNELAIAQRNCNLHRNYHGYSTHANCDMVGIGMTSIGKIGNVYSQNKSTLEEYNKDIESGFLPIFRGYTLDFDDQLRAEVISCLLCNFYIYIPHVEDSYHIRFSSYFYEQLVELQQMQDDGLLEITNENINILPAGKLLIRNICAVFDNYQNDNVISGNNSGLS